MFISSNKVIIIQPLGDFPASGAYEVYHSLGKINPNTFLIASVPLPENSFYAPRNRYRADSLINFLRRKVGRDTVIIGITVRDISTTKNNIVDWGIMGLGFCPGNACVVSTFRLSKGNQLSQFYKVCIHELGHTQGLPHCPDNTCFMRDAEGGNPLDAEKDFCPHCKSFLRGKGWQLK